MKSRSARKVKKKANWTLRFLVFAGVAFLFVQLWRSQDQLNKAEEQSAAYDEQIALKTVIVEDLAALKDGDIDAILKREANKLGFYLPGQQIYMESVG